MKQVWKFTAAAAAVLCFSGGALAADHVMDADIVIVGAGAGGMTAGAAAVDNPKSRSKPSRYSSENDVLIEKSVKYTDFFLLSIVYV